MEHFKHPQNKKHLHASNFAAGQDNPSCGDRINIEGRIKDGIIDELGFSGSGCVISQATTDIIIEHCKGKTPDEIMAITKDDVLRLIGITLGPTRLRCALLGLQVLQEGIKTFRKTKENL